MTILQAELERLYIPRDPNHPSLKDGEPFLITPDGNVRAMVIELGRPADWTVLSSLWQRVQADLGLPAPAIAVSGIDAYQLWFSLSECVPAERACAFLEALRLRYLRTVATERIRLMPFLDISMPSKCVHAPLVPALQKETGRWSAFVTSDLAAIFADEPWLDLPPSEEAQAHILNRLECIKAVDFEATLDRVSAGDQKQFGKEDLGNRRSIDTQERDGAANTPAPQKWLDPKLFLLDVLNDPAVELRLRIKAAKALLPHFSH